MTVGMPMTRSPRRAGVGVKPGRIIRKERMFYQAISKPLYYPDEYHKRGIACTQKQVVEMQLTARTGTDQRMLGMSLSTSES